MKRIITALIIVFSVSLNYAQVTNDTVSLGASYTSQKWYSLPDDEQGSAPKGNWDLAFEISGFGSAIHINSVAGCKLWVYPNGDTSAWATVDTTGLSGWTELYNSDTSWSWGAFDQTKDPLNDFDFGWGVYNINTHVLTGDSIYIIKLTNGSFQKLWIQNLTVSGAYNFRHAMLDGSMDMMHSVVKSTFPGKNFGYHSLSSHSSVDREPASADWDLLFTNYTGYVPQPYPVVGVLHNKGVSVAKVNGVNPSTYDDWNSHTFDSKINTIGYDDWKEFNGTGYDIADSLVYFVKRKNGEVWKVVFTGFGGSATGDFMFSKEQLSGPTTGINAPADNEIANLFVYPNPSSGNDVTLVYDLEKSGQVSLEVYDLMGKTIYSSIKNAERGLNTHRFSTRNVSAGVYVVKVESEGKQGQRKLIVQ